MQTTKEDDRERVTAYLEPGIIEKLDDEARRELRTRNMQITKIITSHYEEQEHEKSGTQR